MANVRVWFRESVGVVVSAAVTAALFGAPVAGLVGQVVTDLVEVVAVQPERIASIVHEAPFADVAIEEAEEIGEVAVEQTPEERPAPEAQTPPEAEGAEGAEEVASGEAEQGGAPAPVATDPVAVDPSRRRLAAEGRARRVVKPDLGDANGDAVLAISEIFDEAGDAGGRKRGSKARCAKEVPEIRAVGERSYTVHRSLVEYYTSSFSRLNSLGWSGKYDEGDEKGWKVSGFGCNSPLYRAGLRRGDVIQSVNGRNTKNIFQVFTTWKKLRKMDEFDIVLLRKGEVVRLHYRLI